MKKILITLLCCLSLVGCQSTVSDKTYTSHGLTITMNDGFTEKELVNATVYYLANDAIFMGLKENFTDLETIGINSESTEDDYASAVLENNKADYELQKEGTLRYFTYEKEVSGKNYFYLSAVVKSNDSFWLLTFASDVKDRDKYEPLFKTWAKSVKFE